MLRRGARRPTEHRTRALRGGSSRLDGGIRRNVVDLTYGILGVLLGGILNGSFVAPMKKLHKWRWENSWLVYSISGLLIIPWIAALTTVPKLGEVLAGASSGAL